MPIAAVPLPVPKAGGFQAAGLRTNTWRWGSGSKPSVAKPQSAASEWVKALRAGLAGWKRCERCVRFVANACKVDSYVCRVDRGADEDNWMYMSRVSEE